MRRIENHRGFKSQRGESNLNLIVKTVEIHSSKQNINKMPPSQRNKDRDTIIHTKTNRPTHTLKNSHRKR